MKTKNRKKRIFAVVILLMAAESILSVQSFAASANQGIEVPSGDAEYARPSEAVISASKSFNLGLLQTEEIPETEEDYPYLSVRPDRTKGAVDLEEWGYEEKEYFISGKANSYTVNDENQLSSAGDASPNRETCKEPNYTDRIMVFRPEDPEDFNGAVFVEIMNASSGTDVPNLWRQGYDFLMRSGYIYIGVTSKDLAVNSLKQFNSIRYEKLVWPDNGVIWDILGQLGVELKSGHSPILYDSEVPEGLYLYGSSQSGWYVNSYASYFGLANFLIENPESLKKVEDVRGEHIYDGYFSLVGGFMHNEIGGGGMRMFQPVYATDVPYMLMVGENDYNPLSVRRSANTQDNKYRHYVVAGASHCELMYDVDPLDSIQMKAGRKAAEYQYFGKVDGHPLTASDFNFSVFINAALENLHLWAAKGIPAPEGQYMDEISGTMNEKSFVPERDEFGNMTSGILSPQILVPYASYFGSEKGPGNYSLNHGSMACLDDEVISSLYTDFDDYLNQYEAALKTVIDTGFILEEDSEKMMDIARKAPVFGNLGRDAESIEKSMVRKTVKQILNSFSGNGFSGKEYLVSGEGYVYGVLKDDLIYKRRMNAFPYTNYLKMAIPGNFNGNVVIDLIVNGEETEDIAPYMAEGIAYIGITADPEAAKSKGGNWNIPTEINSEKEEFGFVWDIISQTVTDIRKNDLTGTNQEIIGITLGADRAESNLVCTYGQKFADFHAYVIDLLNSFDEETAAVLSTCEIEMPEEVLQE